VTAATSSTRSAAIDRFEIFATFLLALATVATAWSSYQATRWNGEQTRASSRANALRIESTKAANLANAQTEVDVITFTQWLDAYAREETELADFYRARFRAEFKPAFEAWLASEPLQNPDVPQTPFLRDEYVVAAQVEADQKAADAEVFSARARTNIQRGSNYVLCVVLFAAALFFAGASARFQSRGPRLAVLAIGSTLFIGALIWVATFPISVAV
jgi:hypothetical protein